VWLHAKLFAIAVKYQADGLRELANMRFKEATVVHWDHEDFAHAIHIVYHSTTDDFMDLCAIVADTIHKHFDRLGAKETVKALMSSVPGLAFSLLERARGNQHNDSTLLCKKGHGAGQWMSRSCTRCSSSSACCESCACGVYSVKLCPICGHHN
jgi:hypothetical protein